MEGKQEHAMAQFWRRYEHLWTPGRIDGASAMNKGGDGLSGGIEGVSSMGVGGQYGVGESGERKFGELIWRSKNFDRECCDDGHASVVDYGAGGGHGETEERRFGGQVYWRSKRACSSNDDDDDQSEGAAGPGETEERRLSRLVWRSRNFDSRHVVGGDDRDGSSSMDGHHEGIHARRNDGPLDMMTMSADGGGGGSRNSGPLLPRDWDAMLGSPSYHRYTQWTGYTIPTVGFVKQYNEIVAFDHVHGRWSITSFTLPNNTAIRNAWSAGPNLLVQLQDTISSFLDPAIYLWHPFKNCFSELPRFRSITHFATLGYGARTIAAIGTNKDGRFVIEMLPLQEQEKATRWQLYVVLSMAFTIPPLAEIVEKDGSFYTLCSTPPGTMLEFKTTGVRWVFAHADSPASDLPSKLLLCHNTLCLVHTDIINQFYKLWSFQQPECRDNYHWAPCFVDAPDYSGHDLRYVTVRGVGSLLYFFFPNRETFVLDLDTQSWHRLPDCPTDPTTFPFTLEMVV